MEGKKEVIKHSAAIYIQNNITLLQRRAWNLLLANAYDDLLVKDEYATRVSDLMEKLEFDSKNEEYLKESLRALVTCAVEWNILGKDKKHKWGISTLLADAEIENGICRYSYGAILRKRLHNPTMYARISLSMQNKFDSKYALALWELCVDFLNEAKNYGETRFIAVEDFKQIMGVAEKGYTSKFKMLNHFVIKPAVKEINRITDFHVEAEEKREKRKVVAIKFKVRRVSSLPGQAIKQGNLFPEIEYIPPTVSELKNTGLAEKEAWEIYQQSFNGVDVKVRPRDIGGDPEATFLKYVREKTHLLKRQQAEGKIKSVTGFLREAIRKNYANPEFSAEEKRRETQAKVKEKRVSDREGQRREELKKELTEARDADIHQLCGQMLQDSPALLEEAAESISRGNPAVKQACQQEETLLKSYQERAMVWVLVDQWLVKHYPERFAAIHERYQEQISALDRKKTVAAQAAA